MNSKYLVIIAFSTFFFVVMALIFSLPRGRETSLESVQDNVVYDNIKKEDNWLDVMADNESSAYSYPTNEMVLKYSFHRGVEPLRIFVQDLNEYRFYCINQILIENKIEYAYYKTSSVIQLVIFLNDVKMQKKILEDFQYFNIQYSLYASKQ